MESNRAGLEGALVADGRNCPGCAKDIGVWPVFSAGLPNLIRCPHCNARLGYRGIFGVCVVLSIVTVVVIGGAFLAAVALPGFSYRLQLAVFAALALVAWVPVELVITWYLRRHCELVRLDKPAPGWDERLS
jgi:hypothetical protein